MFNQMKIRFNQNTGHLVSLYCTEKELMSLFVRIALSEDLIGWDSGAADGLQPNDADDAAEPTPPISDVELNHFLLF
ncbi:unnamed protein product [Caenorhabditis nigoni]